MGSLTPGWDAAELGAPKDLTDYNDNEAPAKRGYFATYSLRKSARKKQGDQLQPIPSEPAAPSPAAATAGGEDADWRKGVASLRRSSMPTLSSTRVPVERVYSDDLQAPLLERHLDRSMTLQPPGARRAVSESQVRRQESGYMDPMESDRRHPSSLDAYKIGHAPDQQDKPNSTWWKKLDSGALNVMVPEEEEPARRGKEAPFRPQFSVTGQATGAFRLHTHTVADEVISEAPSQFESSTANQSAPDDAQAT